MLCFQQQPENAVDLGLGGCHRLTALEHGAVTHHLCLYRRSEAAIDGVEAGLCQLEPIQIG
jgi:hypothetical protein